MTEVKGKLFGRGATDDKGPVLCTLHAIEAYERLGLELPVNLKVSRQLWSYNYLRRLRSQNMGLAKA